MDTNRPSGFSHQSDAAGVLTLWSELFSRKDRPGLARLYTTTALFFGSTPELRRGQDGIDSYFAPLQNLNAPSVTFTDVAMQDIAPGVVDMACVATFSFGGQAVPGRLTWTLVKQQDGWRIASHHASPMPTPAG